MSCCKHFCQHDSNYRQMHIFCLYCSLCSSISFPLMSQLLSIFASLSLSCHSSCRASMQEAASLLSHLLSLSFSLYLALSLSSYLHLFFKASHVGKLWLLFRVRWKGRFRGMERVEFRSIMIWSLDFCHTTLWYVLWRLNKFCLLPPHFTPLNPQPSPL